MRRIVALDPGGTTGIAVRTEFIDGTHKWHFEQIAEDKHHLTLYNKLYEWWVSSMEFHLVCESFEFRKHVRDNVVLVSLEYIGVVKLFHQTFLLNTIHGPSDFHFSMQTAAQAKGFVSDEMLKQLGVYVPGKVHARDATRHLIYYMAARMNRFDILQPIKEAQSQAATKVQAQDG